jgi:predicted kinase
VEAVVFCGIQASGKSTFYRERFFATHVRVSLDLLRTRHREAAFLRTCLETRQRFVVDNTNPTVAERARYVQPALEAGFTVVAFLFEVPASEALARNARREGRERIVAKGVLGTRKRLEPPSAAEGFSALHRVRPGPDGAFEVQTLLPLGP